MTTTQKQAKRQRKGARKSRKQASIIAHVAELAKDLRGGKSLLEAGRNAVQRLPPLKQRRKRQVSLASGVASTFSDLAPAAIGVGFGASFMRMSDKAQVLTDVSGPNMPVDSVRVSFSDLMQTSVSYDGTHQQQALLITGPANVGGIRFGPAEIGYRIAQIAANYGFYAFRTLKIRYCPIVGTSSAGSIALAVDMATDFASATLTAGITNTSVMEHAVSGVDSVWKEFEITYRHTGTEVWETSTTGAIGRSAYQAVLWGAFIGQPSTATQGFLRVWGEIDFYKMDNLVSSISLQEDRLWKRYIGTEWVRYRDRPDAENISFLDFYDRYADQIKLRERSKVPDRRPRVLIAYSPSEEKKHS